MDDNHPYWHGADRRYRKLSHEQMERSRAESLKDAADRIMPFYNKVIQPAMKAGNKCLIVSHANTIRTLIKHIDNISDEDIKGMTIPTGIPLLYRLDRNMKPVDPKSDQEFRFLIEPKGYVCTRRVMLALSVVLVTKPSLFCQQLYVGYIPGVRISWRLLG
jgi:2,3-bisphosphoglycerate-dependent phosphoglycerate mutase